MKLRSYQILRAVRIWALFGLAVPILLLTAQVVRSEVGTEHVRLVDNVRSLLFSMAARVPDYADWHFGWVSNYRTGYTIAAQVAYNKIQSHLNGAVDQSVIEIAERYYTDALRRRVIVPDRFSSQLQKLAFDRLELSLAEEERTSGLTGCPTNPSDAACSTKSETIRQMRGQFLNIIFVEAVAQEAFSPHKLLNLDKNVVFSIHRAYRPLVIRTSIFIVRATEMASILLFLTGAIRGIFGIPNSFIVVSIISLMLIYGIDYSFSRIDASLNQASFEADLSAEILKQEPHLVQYVESWTQQQTARYSIFLHEPQNPSSTVR